MKPQPLNLGIAERLCKEMGSQELGASRQGVGEPGNHLLGRSINRLICAG